MNRKLGLKASKIGVGSVALAPTLRPAYVQNRRGSRDGEARSERRLLERVDVRGAAHVQRRAEPAGPSQLQVLRPVAAVHLAVELLELPDLLGRRHAREQRLDARLEAALRPRGGRGRRRRRRLRGGRHTDGSAPSGRAIGS